MNICGNSGVPQTNLIGYLTGYPVPVRYDSKSIFNILPMVITEERFMITNGE